jgi:hypothetical protein
MANENKDVIRHEDTTANLPSTSRPGQVTFENDGLHRMRRVGLNPATVSHWTDDEHRSDSEPVDVSENTYAKGSPDGVGLVNGSTTDDGADVVVAPAQSVMLNPNSGDTSLQLDKDTGINLLTNQNAFIQTPNGTLQIFSDKTILGSADTAPMSFQTDKSNNKISVSNERQYQSLGDFINPNQFTSMYDMLVSIDAEVGDYFTNANGTEIQDGALSPVLTYIGNTSAGISEQLNNWDDFAGMLVEEQVSIQGTNGIFCSTGSDFTSGEGATAKGSAVVAGDTFTAWTNSNILASTKGSANVEGDSYKVTAIDDELETATAVYIPQPTIELSVPNGALKLLAPDLTTGGIPTIAATTGEVKLLTYTPENVANKVTSISGSSTDTQYTSAKLLYDQLLAKLATAAMTDSSIDAILHGLHLHTTGGGIGPIDFKMGWSSAYALMEIANDAVNDWILSTYYTGGTLKAMIQVKMDQSGVLFPNGDIGATGVRVKKVWVTDFESTNIPTVSGVPLSTTYMKADQTSPQTLGATGTRATKLWTSAIEKNISVSTVNPLTVADNAVTVPITHDSQKITNNAAGAIAITIATANAVDGQMLLLAIYDYSAAAQTLTWVNTETGSATVPATTRGSTTLPLYVGLRFNGTTSLWACLCQG